MHDYAKLSGLAEAELDTLRADGVDLTPADVVQINALAWEVESPESRRLLSRGVPVFVGGVTLWPLTLYAEEWKDRVAKKLPASWRTVGLAYAMAHGHTDDALNIDGWQALKAVKRWHKKLRCKNSELHVAMHQILSQDKGGELPPDNGDGKALTIGELSSLLAATAGATPEFWERRCSVSYCFSVLSAIARQNAADGKPLAGDPRLRAERALGWAIERIRRRAAGNEQA
jgi:hypothetical protein